VQKATPRAEPDKACRQLHIEACDTWALTASAAAGVAALRTGADNESMRAVVLADTHIRDGGASRLSERAWEELHTADVVLHAGDIVDHSLLDQLGAIAPVHAVLGNNDIGLAGVLPTTIELELGGVPIAMVHDSGPRRGREVRLHRRFPTARVVVFGHSHVPWNERGVEGQLLFNPGSATQRRRQPHRTLGLLHLDADAVQSEIVVVD
jgi:putative phosphoesterase